MKNLLLVTTALAFVIGATELMADDRRGFDRGRGNDRSWDRGFNPPGRSFNNNGNRWSRVNDRSRVSINVNVNNRWRPAYRPYNNWNTFGSGIGYSVGFGSWGSGFSAWSTPAPVYRQRQPVVVYQNTYIDATPVSPVTTTLRSGTSLLRDINGRCFERSFDNGGNEIRVELPASACNF